MKYSNFTNISLLFQTSLLLHRNIFCVTNSIFRPPKDCFSVCRLMYFAGCNLGLIILKWNGINEVAVTDPIVRKKKLIFAKSCSKTKFRDPISLFFWKTIYSSLCSCWAVRNQISLSFKRRYKTRWCVCRSRIVGSLIINYNISNKDRGIQSDNASCKNLNIILGYYNHWLMSLTWGSYVHMGLRNMAREWLIVLVKWLNISIQKILCIFSILFQWRVLWWDAR